MSEMTVTDARSRLSEAVDTARVSHEQVYLLRRVTTEIRLAVVLRDINGLSYAEIADALQTGLDPRGVLVVLTATHGCVSDRGVRQAKSSTVTMASRGMLKEPLERAEIMAMIGAQRE